MRKTGEEYPFGQYELPLECKSCVTIITNENEIAGDCDYKNARFANTAVVGRAQNVVIIGTVAGGYDY